MKMNVCIEEKKIIIDFNKMNEIGGEPVSKINDIIKNFREEQKLFAKIRNNDIINHVLNWGYLIIENEDELIKRDNEILEYVFNCGYNIFDTDEKKIKKYKKIDKIRRQGKNDWVLTTNKQMIMRFDKIIEIKKKCYNNYEESIRNNINDYTFTKDQKKAWINALIEVNSIERLLEIFERQHLDSYYYLIAFYNQIVETFNWFFNRIVRKILGVSCF